MIIIFHNTLSIKDIRSFWHLSNLALFGFVLGSFFVKILDFGLEMGKFGFVLHKKVLFLTTDFHRFFRHGSTLLTTGCSRQVTRIPSTTLRTGNTDLCIATESTEFTEKLKFMVLEVLVIFILPMLTT